MTTVCWHWITETHWYFHTDIHLPTYCIKEGYSVNIWQTACSIINFFVVRLPASLRSSARLKVRLRGYFIFTWTRRQAIITISIGSFMYTLEMNHCTLENQGDGNATPIALSSLAVGNIGATLFNQDPKGPESRLPEEHDMKYVLVPLHKSVLTLCVLNFAEGT